MCYPVEVGHRIYEDWIVVDYLTYLWDGARAKKQRIRRNMRSAKEALRVEGMAGVQYHDHHSQEWETWHVDEKAGGAISPATYTE